MVLPPPDAQLPTPPPTVAKLESLVVPTKSPARFAAPPPIVPQLSDTPFPHGEVMGGKLGVPPGPHVATSAFGDSVPPPEIEPPCTPARNSLLGDPSRTLGALVVGIICNTTPFSGPV